MNTGNLPGASPFKSSEIGSVRIALSKGNEVHNSPFVSMPTAMALTVPLNSYRWSPTPCETIADPGANRRLAL